MSEVNYAANPGKLAVAEEHSHNTGILSLQQQIEHLQCKVRELSAVAEVQRAIAPLPSLEQLLAQIIEKVGELLDVEKAGVMLYDPERKELVLQRPAFGVDDDELINTYHVPLDGKGNAIAVFLSGEPYISNDTFNDPRMIQESVRLFDARSVMTVPLLVENQRIGVLHVCNKRNGQFDQNDLQTLRLLAAHLAALIENARLHEREKQRIHELEKLNVLIGEQRDKLERATTIHERLTQMVLHDSGIDVIARTLANLVENPVTVEDKFFRPISYAPCPVSGTLQESGAAEFHGTPAEALDDPRFKEHVKLMARTKRPIEIPAYPQYGLFWRRLIATITAGKTTFGYVSIFEKNRQFRVLDLVAIEHATTVFALELQKQKTAFEVEQRLKGDFLDDLLAGNYDSSELVLRRAAFLDYDLSHPHAVMIVDIDNFGAFLSNRSSDEREAAHIKRKLFDLVHTSVSATSSGSMVVSKSDSVIILLKLKNRSSGEDWLVDPKELAEGIRREVGRYLAPLTVSISISGECKRPADYKRSYQIARKSLDIVKTFGQRDRIVSCDRLGVNQLLLQIEDKAELKEFVDELIGPLISYDRNHNSSLIETLEGYLQNDCNLQKTARVTFVHVSTLKYRLQRIEEIAKVDLSDVEARLGLHLGLKVWRLLS